MKKSLLILVFVCLIIKGFGQAKKAEIIGAYIYNFAKLSSSESFNKSATYNIALVSETPENIAEFKKMEQEMKINNKTIKLIIDPNATANYKFINLVFVATDKTSLYEQIYHKTLNTKTLIVSENLTNKRHVLLNLSESADRKMQFEMNKGNIYSRGIKIDDEILLMGGTIIDLAELYITSQKELKDQELKINSVQKKLKKLEEKLRETQAEINKEASEIKKLNTFIEDQKNERQQLTLQINNYKTQLLNKQKAYKESQDNLTKLNENIEDIQDKLSDSEQEISTNKKVLSKQEKYIKANKKTLSRKNQIIKNQRVVVIYFILGTLVTLTMLIIALKNYRDKKKKNILLEQQKEEISRQYAQLEDNNRFIEKINDEIGEKNEELTASLESIKEMQEKLVQSEKMASLGVLSAGIAHEINNPINFVYAGINSLLRDFEDIKPVIEEVSNVDVNHDNFKEKIERIKQLKEEYYFEDAIEAIPDIINDIKLGADRTTEIVKGLRNFSRLDKNISEPMQINEGLNTSLLLLRNKYKDKIEVIKKYDNIPEFNCFPGKINQAFLNILANAIDSIKEKGKLWITTKLIGDMVTISIKDTGVGISNENQKKIFDPFFTTKQVGHGTGLGLSITFGIIQEHNGTIDVVSEVNKGSEFIITLPLNKPGS